MGSMRRATKAGVPRDIEWVFSLFPILAQRRHQSGATLSGGEQQMLAMGRALMAEPRLLMLDEPSLGLAPLVVRAIFQVIRELHRRGVTILLVEQNVRQALAVADRGYVLSTGKVLLEGAGRDLRSNPEIERAYLSTASGTRE
jgi:branched-chain amino acid transport system ATP-binding protein